MLFKATLEISNLLIQDNLNSYPHFTRKNPGNHTYKCYISMEHKFCKITEILTRFVTQKPGASD
jgi:hypothetical protein